MTGRVDMTDDWTVLLRAWPETGALPAPKHGGGHQPRLWQGVALYLHHAAARDVSGVGPVLPERFGLGAAIVATGPSVFCGCLIVPDTLAESDPDALDEITRWAGTHALATAGGIQPWRVVTRSAFYDPRATVTREPWAFQPNAYSGAGWVVGADLGRSFGLAAEHCGARKGRHRDEWEVWLPGWGKKRSDGWRRASPHRPCLYLSARRVGWHVEFGPVTAGHGKQVSDRLWRGRFLDVLSLAYALDAKRGASFDEHCASFGVDAAALACAVPVNADGAAQVAATVGTIRQLAGVLDEDAGRWFTSSQDRRERAGRIDLTRTVSPGALARQIVEVFGLRSPLEVFGLDATERARWAEAFHGGWCDADPRLVGMVFPALSADVSSCYPLVAHHIGWWDLLCAYKITRRGVTRQLRALCRRAAGDPTVALDPAIWRRFGVTLVEVVPDGEPWTVALDDPARPDGRTEAVLVHSNGRSMFYAWPDVVAAAVLSGQAPKIVRAVRYLPEGCQETLRHRVPLVAGCVLDAGDDPAVAMVQLRRQLKASGDPADRRVAAELRVVVNSLVYGNLCRFDELWRRKGKRGWERSERPGYWSCLPIAASVASGAHLLLAVLERQVSDAGGTVAYRDTDSSLIPATPSGATIALSDGKNVEALSWGQVDAILGAFDELSPARGWPVWGVERGTTEDVLRAVVYGPKRHAQIVGTDVVGMTEAQLGGTYVDPPTMAGRGRLGYRAWSEAAVARGVGRTDAGPGWQWQPVGWDSEGELPFPALRRFSVRNPAMAKALPASFGARPGTRYVSAENLWSDEKRSPVALDPGGNLARWHQLAWCDKSTGESLAVSTDPLDIDRVHIASLADKTDDWRQPSRLAPIDSVTVGAVRYVGRVSGVIDADAAGAPGALDDYRPRYPARCATCGQPVPRAKSTYCSTPCRETAKKRRQRAAKATSTRPDCGPRTEEVAP